MGILYIEGRQISSYTLCCKHACKITKGDEMDQIVNELKQAGIEIACKSIIIAKQCIIEIVETHERAFIASLLWGRVNE